MPPSSASFDEMQGLAAKTVRQRYLLLFIALTVAVVVSLLVNDRYVVYLARLTLLNIIVVYALNITLGYAGQASICIAAIFAVGAYASAIGVMRLGVPFILAWPIGALLAGLFGILSALPALRLAGAYLAMVSIAFNVVAERVLIHGGDVTGGPVGMPAIPPIRDWLVCLQRTLHLGVDCGLQCAGHLLHGVLSKLPMGPGGDCSSRKRACGQESWDRHNPSQDRDLLCIVCDSWLRGRPLCPFDQLHQPGHRGDSRVFHFCPYACPWR